jgi:hypothetical protein
LDAQKNRCIFGSHKINQIKQTSFFPCFILKGGDHCSKMLNLREV